MFSLSKGFPSIRSACAALAASLLAAMAVCAISFTSEASAATVGPFDVEGPTSAYSWDGAVLTISKNGVTIEGMSNPDAPAGAVVVGEDANTVGIGANVHIATLTVKRSTTFIVSGTGNSVIQVDTVRDDAVGGDGKITIDTGERGIDVFDSAVMRVNGSIGNAFVWEKATLVLGPEADVQGVITAYGGVLDLSQVVIGQPIPVGGVAVGNAASTLAVAAPFGATNLHELLEYQTLLVYDATPVYEEGERIGTLNKDGSFNITATRTVTFEGYDGELIATETVPLFSAATAPDVTAPDGYEFTGWNRTFDYVTEDMTVTAQFAKLPEPEPEPQPEPPAPAPQPGGGSASTGSSTGSVPPTITNHVRSSAAGKALAKTGDAATVPFALIAGTAFLAAGAFAATCIARRRVRAPYNQRR